MQKIITIVGGSGQMGQLFSNYWTAHGIKVQSLGRNDWNNAHTLLNHCDLVLICVPIHDTIQIINQVTPYLNQSTILADFTSIKVRPLEAMLNLHNGTVLGLHPMFGPTIQKPDNQVVINCGGRGDYSWVLDSLRQIGFTITNMDAAAHDKAMSFIQGIEHFSTFVLGSFLKSHNEHPNDLFNLASPIYQAKLALMGRIFDQDANLYADIITADPHRVELIDEYAKYFQQWVNKLSADRQDEFVSEFKDTRQWMGEFTHKSQLASDEFLTAVTDSFPKNS
jgi:prephenate dehydrogenase